MSREPTPNVENELQLLEALTKTPETTQADLAARVGVAVGTVNWYLKRWSQKGYVKIRRIGRWQWSYLLTPEGISRKAQLASEYLEASLSLYRRTRADARRLLQEVRSRGINQVVINSQGEIAEICRLTCLEMGINIIESLDVEKEREADLEILQLPVLTVKGVQLALLWPAEKQDEI